MGSESCDTCGRDGYNNPAVSVDAVVLRQEIRVLNLLIRRGAEPWKGRLGFPGGFVENGEDPEDAVLRERKKRLESTDSTPLHWLFMGLQIEIQESM